MSVDCLINDPKERREERMKVRPARRKIREQNPFLRSFDLSNEA